MKRTILIWAAFAACTAMVLAAMGWITWTALRLESKQIEAQRKADLEENVRLALWRMDSTLMPLIGQESARPYQMYQPLVPTGNAFTRFYSQVEEPVLLPSPLLTTSSPYILCHFQFSPDGELTSPQAPTGKAIEIVQNDLNGQGVLLHGASRRLDDLSRIVDREALLQALEPVPAEPESEQQPSPAAAGGAQVSEGGGNGLPQQAAQVAANPDARQIEQRQQVLNYGEYRLRARNTTNLSVNGLLTQNDAFLLSPRRNVRVGSLKPLWIQDHLLMARRVNVDGKLYVQGMWLDWDGIRESLLRDVRDLLPNADLKPVRDVRPVASRESRVERPGSEGGNANESMPVRAARPSAVDGNRTVYVDESRMLATIPARIVPGTLPVEAGGALSSTKVSLMTAWSCTLLAVLMAAGLLYGVLALSQRRAAFVSAVTHELRTPLTTFQLYTEMLEEGRVADEKRREYLRTLRAESKRLGHLVENVLAYARLEGSRDRIRLQETTAANLMDGVQNRLQQRAEQAGMRLECQSMLPEPAPVVKADPSAVERILFNLVDNACKYASGDEHGRIEIGCSKQGPRVEFRVRDYGPGAGGQPSRRLFRAFSKSAREAAQSKPGIGLGLALGRALARKLGGELFLDRSVKDGACFVLSLPIVSPNGSGNGR